MQNFAQVEPGTKSRDIAAKAVGMNRETYRRQSLGIIPHHKRRNDLLRRLSISDWSQRELFDYVTAPTAELIAKAARTVWPDQETVTDYELATIEQLERNETADSAPFILQKGRGRV